MRTLFILIGGLSILGAAIDGAMAALFGLIVSAGRLNAGMSVEALLRDLLPALASMKDAAVRHGIDPMLLIFAALALVYFLLRIVLGLTIGAAAIAASRRTQRP